MTSPDSDGHGHFFPCIRFYFTDSSFNHEARVHEWDTTRPGLWFTVREDDWTPNRTANGGMNGTCYIQGNSWQALHGHPFFPGGETLLLLAAATDPKSGRSMTLEFLDDPPRESAVTIFEPEDRKSTRLNSSHRL